MNPFKQLQVYNNDYVERYQGVRLGELPPHIFAVADETYFRLLRDKSNQCVVIRHAPSLRSAAAPAG
jgi:myosin-7